MEIELQKELSHYALDGNGTTTKKVSNYSTSIPLGMAINEIQDSAIIIILQTQKCQENIDFQEVLS